LQVGSELLAETLAQVLERDIESADAVAEVSPPRMLHALPKMSVGKISFRFLARAFHLAWPLMARQNNPFPALKAYRIENDPQS